MRRTAAGEDNAVLSGAIILLVEDDPSVATVVRHVLVDQGCDVTWVKNVRDALALSNERFDAAVLDVGLPDGHGFEVLEALRRREAPCSVVMMTGDPNDSTVSRSIRAGVSEFLAKPFRAVELTESVQRCLELTHEFRSRIALARGTSHDDDASPDNVPDLPADEVHRIARLMASEGGLTEREHETLQLILAGLQNTDIARSLAISSNTVKYHVRNVLTKLGLKSRTELFRTLLHRSHSD